MHARVWGGTIVPVPSMFPQTQEMIMAATGGFPGQPTGESSGQDVPPSTPPQAVAPHPTMWTVQAANGDVHTFDTEQEANDSADGGSVIPPQPE